MRIALTLDKDASRREENDYIRALMHAGFAREEIVVLPPGSKVTGDFDGVVIGGGVDVDPARYGEAPRPDAGLEVDHDRDATDFAVFDKAWEEGTPLLGICRGLQVVNVALGGTLVQDIPTEHPSEVTHRRREKDKARRDHPVRILPATRLSGIAGSEEMPVNSRHHQAIGKRADGLRVSATSPDGLVEAVEGGSDRWLVAVQWHPENLEGDPPSERLFAEFARAVRERSAGNPAREPAVLSFPATEKH